MSPDTKSLVGSQILGRNGNILPSEDIKFHCTCCQKNLSSPPPKEKQCECERRHNQITSAIRGEVKLAARVGIDLLEQLQQLDNKMAQDNARFSAQIAELMETNKKLMSKNLELDQNAETTKHALLSSQQQITSLSTELERVKGQAERLKSYVKLANSLESQVESLEAMQADMSSELDVANQTRGLYEKRWRAAEKMIKQMAVAYDQLEASLPQGVRHASTELSIARARLDHARGSLRATSGGLQYNGNSGGANLYTPRLLTRHSLPDLGPSVGLATPDFSALNESQDQDISEIEHINEIEQINEIEHINEVEQTEDSSAEVSNLDNMLAGLDSDVDELPSDELPCEDPQMPVLMRSQSHESVLSVVYSTYPQVPKQMLHLGGGVEGPRFAGNMRIASADISRELGAGIVNRSRDTAASNMRTLLQSQRYPAAKQPTESSLRQWLSFGRS